MKIISADKIKSMVADLCIKANLNLRSDIVNLLKSACRSETNKKARDVLHAIIENARVARKEKLAICQDTGMPFVLVEIGNDVRVRGDLKKAINKGIELGYKKGNLRDSIVAEPLSRGKPGFVPAVIHFDFVKGSKIKITVLPKGFGSENKSQLKMFAPTASEDQIKRFIVDAVRLAGPDACPPYVVGIGIGGTADYACFLAKKALLRDTRHAHRDTKVKQLERELLKDINKLNIGPMGLGGKTTALAVNIETYPTHIAGMPVAVNISCHATRSATVLI